MWLYVWLCDARRVTKLFNAMDTDGSRSLGAEEVSERASSSPFTDALRSNLGKLSICSPLYMGKHSRSVELLLACKERPQYP